MASYFAVPAHFYFYRHFPRGEMERGHFPVAGAENSAQEALRNEYK
ncbi:MAG: hypothetical protein FWC16_12480 [Defluviitaleaceae bacterium]|nr:hypothetical protein [Defluviitaleaceae bacterium]MCL2275737.1 hypothetical protein [Defluviitaleaceae bacterium]